MSHTVYTYWADRQPLYVGVSMDADRRVRQHRSARWAVQATHITGTEFASAAAAYAAEIETIERLQPRYNVRHNPRYGMHVPKLTREQMGREQWKATLVIDGAMRRARERLLVT
jgi:excinuclease UvrABC nuclease subunit